MSDYVFVRGTLCVRIASFNLYTIEGQGRVTHSVRVGGLTYRLAIFFTKKRDAYQHHIHDVYIKKCFSQTSISNKTHFFFFHKKSLTLVIQKQNIIELNFDFSMVRDAYIYTN